MTNGANVESVTGLVMDSLTRDCGNLNWNEVAKKLVSFGVDGALVF